MTDKPKRPRDANQLAKAIVDLATEEASEKPAKVAAQRKGGLLGGKARAEALHPNRRAEIAASAAKARWKKDLVDE